MRKRIIRILTVLLVVCFGMAIFAACNGPEVQTQKKSYTVTYAANEGTGEAPAKESYEEGKTFTVKENMFTREGYTFKTWNDGTNDYAAGSTYTMPAKDVTFKAQWEKQGETPPGQKFTVTYSLGDYTEGKAPAAVQVESGKQVTLPTAPAWAGHTFKGWKVGSDATLKKAGEKITVTADVTVTAQWETEVQKEQVTVTFDLGYTGAQNPAPEKTNKGEEYELPAAPARDGFYCTGWKIGDTEEVKKAGETITPNADVTLTAQWKEVSYAITGVSLEKTENLIYFVVSGTYTGYEADEMIDALNNSDKNVLKIGLWAGGWQELDTEAEAENGEWSFKLDVTDLEVGEYSPCANQEGHGDIAWNDTYAANETLGGIAYKIVKRTESSGDFIKLVVADLNKTFKVTDASIAIENDTKVIIALSGTFEGYTKESFKAAVEDADDTKVGFRIINAGTIIDGKANWDKVTGPTSCEIGEGIFTVKFDVTEFEARSYYVNKEEGQGKSDIKGVSYDNTVELNQKSFQLHDEGGAATIALIIKDNKGTCTVTGLDLTLDETAKKVYLTVSGTFEGYTEAELKALLGADGAKNIHFWDEKAGTEYPASIAVTVSGKNWSAKCDVTDIKEGVLRNILVDGELHLEFEDKTVTLGDKQYTLQKKNGYGHNGLKVETATTPEPPIDVTFSDPTSVTLEVSKSDGREEGKLFREEVDAAFIVFSGSYTGEATQEIANTYFSQANYSFKFIAKEQKDRLRRISIDTEAKTWTLKIDITPLPATDNKCVLKDADLKLEIPQDATKEVKALGSTFTIKNGEDGTLIVNVKHDYTVSNIDLVDEDGTPLLVMTGTYDENVWKGEEIKKFFEDDDIRTLSLNLVAYIWPMNDTYNVEVTAENGQYTVKLDISGVAATNGTGVLSEASGYGDIIMADVNKTVSTDTKKFTLFSGEGNAVTLKVELLVEPKCEVTELDIEADEATQKVYLIISGTFEGYTEAELKALFEGTNKMYVHFWGSKSSGENPASVAVTVDGANWSAKCDVTGLSTVPENTRNILCGGELNLVFEDKTVTLGDKKYTLQCKNGGGWDHNGLKIEAAYAFLAPSSAGLELMNDKGNGTDENFKNEIERVFFVISGSYTGEVTEELAKEYFKQANYPFEFSDTKAKDRMRRISIDTDAKTYTVKFDVSGLAEGNYYCRFGPNGGNEDFRISTEACPNTTLQAVGGTFTLTNYYGQAMDPAHMWACIVLNVKFNYAITGANLEEADGKALLVVEGTYDQNLFTAEKIQKFLADEDVRSMCVTVYPYLYPTDENYHVTVTAAEGKFTVKLDLSVLDGKSYGILANGNGVGDIKNVTVNAKVTAGSKVYTLVGTNGSALTLTIDAFHEEIGKTDNSLAFTGDNPVYTDTLKKGQIISFKGTMTSKAGENFHAPVLYLYSKGATSKLAFRIDWFVVGVTNEDVTTYATENWKITKYVGPAWDEFTNTIKSGKLVLSFNWLEENAIYLSFFVAGDNGLNKMMIFKIEATDGSALKDSYAIGIGGEACYCNLTERADGKTALAFYDELTKDANIQFGNAENTGTDHYAFYNYIKKGEKIVFTGTSSTNLGANWDSNGLYLGSDVVSAVWFRADNFVDGATSTDDNVTHDVAMEGWHITKSIECTKGDVWANFGSILKKENCEYKVTLDWTGDNLVITFEYGNETDGKITTTYTVSGKLADTYNFSLGYNLSSGKLAATEVPTRA